MKSYSDVTPIIQLMDGTYDLDVQSSEYANVRWNVPVDRLVTITAPYVANLPGLAYDVYGNQDYWRAILAFNGLQDPISDVQVGVVIGLPNDAGLQAFLTRTKQSNSVTMTI